MKITFLGTGGGSLRGRPLSVSIEVVMRKKISNMKAISAEELAFTPGAFLFFLAIMLYFITYLSVQ